MAKSIKMGLWREVCWADRTVMDGCMVLGDIICVVVWPWAPKMAELLLRGSAPKPVKFHVH